VIESLYGAAVRVPADDDVTDLEMVERVLKHSREVPVMDRDDVADVSLHKNLAGLRTGDAFGIYS
jgi:hypothetical protein